MNIKDQQLLLKAKLGQRHLELEAQILSDTANICYWISPELQGGIENLHEGRAKVLMDGLVPLIAEYRRVKEEMEAAGV